MEITMFNRTKQKENNKFIAHNMFTTIQINRMKVWLTKKSKSTSISGRKMQNYAELWSRTTMCDVEEKREWNHDGGKEW